MKSGFEKLFRRLTPLLAAGAAGKATYDHTVPYTKAVDALVTEIDSAYLDPKSSNANILATIPHRTSKEDYEKCHRIAGLVADEADKPTATRTQRALKELRKLNEDNPLVAATYTEILLAERLRKNSTTSKTPSATSHLR